MFTERLNVALTFNVKPESETFSAPVSPNQNNPIANTLPSSDTYAEWDTWETINALRDAIALYHNVELVEANEDAYNKFRNIKPDIVFNIAEGANGVSREAQIPAMLELLQIPYSGSDALTLGICLDKSRTKEILTYHKIPNAKFIVANSIQNVNGNGFEFPVMVKPIGEGSSKGIYSSSFVKSNEELKAEIERIIKEYNQPALIEEFLPGREFTVAVLGNGEETKILPIIEIMYSRFPENIVPVYSYEAKWILDTKENSFEVFDCPANIDSVLEEKIKKISLDTYNVLRCRDWSRIDIRIDKNGEPSVIEINPLPGILPDPNENSSFPKAARAAGMTYEDMINTVLYAAAKRYSLTK